jgi:hypothetical protein
VSVDYRASQAAAVGARHTREQDTHRCCNWFAEILCVRAEREVEHRGIDDTDRERIGRIHIHINPEMILKLAEHIEATTRDALPEDRTTGLYKRPPGTPICAAHVRVETIGNDRVTTGAQHNSQAFTERGQPRGVMHQGRLKSVVILDTSGIVEEWIGGGGGPEKRFVTSNRSIWIEPHDAHFPCRGENC